MLRRNGVKKNSPFFNPIQCCLKSNTKQTKKIGDVERAGGILNADTRCGSYQNDNPNDNVAYNLYVNCLLRQSFFLGC